jgi:hypothetical protein
MGPGGRLSRVLRFTIMSGGDADIIADPARLGELNLAALDE